MIISKKNRKHNEVSSNRAELEIVYPRYVVRQPNRLSNCKSIDLLSYRPHDEKTKDSMHLPLSIEKDGVVRGPSQSHRKQSKTKRKSIKMNNGRETPRPHRNISDSKLVTICNRYLNQDRSRSGASQSMKSMDMLRHIYQKCTRMLSDYRQKVDILELENRQHVLQNEELRSRLNRHEQSKPLLP